jgi:hypothetical protein
MRYIPLARLPLLHVHAKFGTYNQTLPNAQEMPNETANKRRMKAQFHLRKLNGEIRQLPQGPRNRRPS